MNRAILTCLLTLSLTMIGTANAADQKALSDEYIKLGQQIVDMTNSGKISAPKVEELVLALTRISTQLADAYAAKYPEGKKLLNDVKSRVAKLDGSGKVTAIGSMADLPFATIEKDWHDLEHYKTNDAGLDMSDEDNEHFTDPLHVMIHPIMVLRASRDNTASPKAEHVAAMKSEMDEGMEQVELLVKSLQ